MKAKPAKAKPTKAKPTKAKPMKAKPMKAKPAKAKPAKSNPAKVKPAKMKPAKVKPAEAKLAHPTDARAASKLFLKAYRYNWDAGMRGLYTILDHQACDRATALLIYWMGNPAFHNDFTSDAAVPDTSKRELELVRTIEQRVRANRYRSVLAFAPATSAITAGAVPSKRGRIPAEMYAPCTGEASADALVDGSSLEDRMVDACRRGNLAEVIACSEAGFGVTTPIQGNPPLSYATYSGSADVVRFLLERGADANKRSGPTRDTPVHGAVGNGHIDVVRVLLEHGADINSPDRWGRTPLHAAAWTTSNMHSDADLAERATLIEFLLAHGANPRAKDEDGKTPLDFAKSSDNTRAAELLRAATR